MKSKKFFFISVTVIAAPILAYFFTFKKASISHDTAIWGQFGDYLNGTFMPLIALMGVAITYLVAQLSNEHNIALVKIDQQRQRPLLHLGYHDGENESKIWLCNKGIGPLIIDDLTLINETTFEVKNCIYDILPPVDEEFLYSNYSGNLKSVVLGPNESFELFRINISTDNTHIYDSNRNAIRKAIGKYKICATYRDVFNIQMPQYERSLRWFLRH